MKLEEYKEKLRKIVTDSRTAHIELGREYATANNTVKVGDKIKDHHHQIEVDKMVFRMTDPPSMIFVGKQLKANGKYRKDGKRSTIYQSNIVDV